jgi:transaldolase
MTTLSGYVAAGVSVWLDDLGRHRITSGELARLVDEVGVRGVTTNPSIFATAVASGEEYRDDLAAGGGDAVTTVQRLMVGDVQAACDVLAETFEKSKGVDGRVSLEVDPGLAFDTDATIEAARKVWQEVDRPNAMVKIPATEAGLPAITETLAAGISVNVTLIFGVDRYRAVQSAWLDGMQRARDAGHDLTRMASVASFFVSRLDTAVDTRLDALLDRGEIDQDTHHSLRGRAAVANARTAYRVFEDARATSQWRQLEQDGGNPQRPLWASTSTKDPTFAPTRYVDELIAPHTVNTMPAKTLDAVVAEADGRAPARTVNRSSEGADRELFEQLAAVGIGYGEVVSELEREGVAAFLTSWNALLGLVDQATSDVAATGR